MTNIARNFTLTAAVVCPLMLVAAVAPPGQSPVTLGLPGRTNANVSVASSDAYVVAAWSASDESGATDIYAAVSRDRGATFSSPVRVNATAGDARVNGEQPPRLAWIQKSGHAPSIVVVWTSKRPEGSTILTARSDDGGRTFGETRVVPGGEGPGNRGWESIVADGQGRVHALWLDHREMAATSGGSPHQHAGHDPSSSSKKDGAAMAQLSKLHTSTLGEPLSALAVTGGVCYCCKTAIAAAHDGALYAAWRHVYPGNLRDIAFTVSRDGGRTFAPATRVSQDRWELEGCPDDGPAMTVDRAGIVRIAWPTLVPGPTPRKGIFYAASADRRTFSERVRLDSGLADPAHPQIATADDGSTAVVWDEVSSGTRRIVLRRIPARGAALPAQTVSEERSGAYPAVAAVSDAMVVAWTAQSEGSSRILVRRLR